MSDAAPSRFRGRIPLDLATVLGPFLTSRFVLVLLAPLTLGLLTPLSTPSVDGWPEIGRAHV